MNPTESVLNLIGNTPILKMHGFDTGPCELFLKLENRNPGGSISDRGALAMIEAAESDGRISPGDTLIEATTGNTGVGLALVATRKGYSLVLVVPENVNRDKVLHLKALGAEVRLARSDVDPGHPGYYMNIASRLAGELPGSCYLDQHANPVNVLAHEKGTAPEIWEQMEQKLDAFVCGAGSGATISGCARYFRSVNAAVEIVLADPEGSVFAAAVNTIGNGAGSGPSLVEDIGGRSIPANLAPDLIDTAYSVSDVQAFAASRQLLKLEGILGGVSTGVHLAAALEYCRAQSGPKRVVSLVCDSGHKYLSTAYDDAWLLDRGLAPRRNYGDLRDIITHPAGEGGVVSISPEDSLLSAYTRIRMFDVSQLPVLDNGRIVGLIDESDLLLAVYDNRKYFGYPVRDFMITRLEKIDPGASISTLVPVFRGDHVAIIADESRFYGLITQVDLIDHLRKSMQANNQ